MVYNPNNLSPRRQSGMASTGQAAPQPGGSGDPNRIREDRYMGMRPAGQTPPTKPLQPGFLTGNKPQVTGDMGMPTTTARPGFATGHQANQVQQPNQAAPVQAQGQATVTQQAAPQAAPTWNPTGDPTTWGNQWNTHQQALNAYTMQQAGGQTKEQAQAEIDAKNRASGTDPNAQLAQTAGGSATAVHGSQSDIPIPAGEERMALGGGRTITGTPDILKGWQDRYQTNPWQAEDERLGWEQQWQASRDRGVNSQTGLNEWSPAYTEEYNRAVALGSPDATTVGSPPAGMQRVSNGSNTWLTPDPRIQDQNMLDQGAGFARKTRGIVDGTWIDKNLNPGMGPRKDMPAQRGGSFSDYVSNLPKRLQPNEPYAYPEPAPTALGGGGQQPGLGTDGLGQRAPNPYGEPAPVASAPPWLTPAATGGRVYGTEPVPAAGTASGSPGGQVNLPTVGDNGVVQSVSDYFRGNKPFDMQYQQALRRFKSDVGSTMDQSINEIANRGIVGQGTAGKLASDLLGQRAAVFENEIKDIGIAGAHSDLEGNRMLGNYALSEAARRAQEGFTARESALGRNLQREMPGIQAQEEKGLIGARGDDQRQTLREQQDFAREELGLRDQYASNQTDRASQIQSAEKMGTRYGSPVNADDPPEAIWQNYLAFTQGDEYRRMDRTQQMSFKAGAMAAMAQNGVLNANQQRETTQYLLGQRLDDIRKQAAAYVGTPNWEQKFMEHFNNFQGMTESDIRAALGGIGAASSEINNYTARIREAQSIQDEQQKKGQLAAILSGLGTVAGLAIGGPAGAAIGGTAGGLLGEIAS